VFPDQGYETVKNQFLLGDSVLVAPIIDKNQGKRTVLLPKGKWKSDDNKTYRGGREIVVDVALDRLLYFVKH